MYSPVKCVMLPSPVHEVQEAGVVSGSGIPSVVHRKFALPFNIVINQEDLMQERQHYILQLN